MGRSITAQMSRFRRAAMLEIARVWQAQGFRPARSGAVRRLG